MSRPYNAQAEHRCPQRLHRAQPHPLLNLQLSVRPNLRWSDLLRGLPEVRGAPILIRDRAQLRVHRGKLVWGCTERGVAVHAASFLREREIVLQSELLRQPNLFRFILVHELFHFVWPKLGNPRRAAFSALIYRERAAGAQGELGDSASLKKERLRNIHCQENSRAWRDYVCESFCDTAAWLYAGHSRDPAFTLATCWRDRRARWFDTNLEAGCAC